MFAAFTRMRKLEEATNGRDEPTPIYLLDELVADAQSGMPEVGLMVEFCVKRLTAKPPIVKQKTLRLIKHFCNKGAHEFRRAMARHSSSVRELTHYKGEPDPLKGDVPNQRVRDAAREALDALFGAENGYAPATPAQPQLTNRIQGFGSTNYSGSGGSGGFSGGGGGGSNEGVGGMLGSGLAMGQSALSKAAGAVSNASSAVSRGVQGFGNPKYESDLRAAPSYSPPAGGGGGSAASPRWGASVAGAAGSALSGAGSAISGAGSAISGALSPRHRGHGSESMLVGQSGGGYDSDDEPSARQQLSARASTRVSPAATGAVADEGELVDRVCAPGGVRATPGEEELRTFVEALAPLDGLEVGRLLAAKMEGPSWQASLRALCALEAVVQQGSSAACGETAVFFQSDPGALHAAAKSPQATVRARARAVLAAIGADTLPETSATSAAATAAAAPTPPAPEPDLMGDLLGPEEPDTQPQALQQGLPAAAEPLAAPAPASGSDLMELLSSPEVPQQQAAPAAASAAAAGSPGGGMFDGLDLASARSGGLAHPAAAPAQQPQDGGSLFGGLALAEPGAAAQQPPSQHVRPPADELADLFTSLSPGGGSDVAVHGSASSFGNSAAASQQPQQALAWSLQPQPQPQPQHQQQPGSSMLPAGGMANGSGGARTHGHGHARTSSGIAHVRTNSGSGAFEDLDIEFRRHKPMGGGSMPARTPSGASGASSQPSFGAVSPPPQFNMAPGGAMPGVSQPQMAQQQMWQQQAPMQAQQYAVYGQQPQQQFAQQQYMQQPQPQQHVQPQYMQQQMFAPLQPGMAPPQQQQQPPLARPAYGSGASFGSGSAGLGSGLGIGHARTNSTGLTGGSPTAAMARETLQQAGVPEGFAPPRPEQQEAAFDFVVDHISQLKK